MGRQYGYILWEFNIVISPMNIIITNGSFDCAVVGKRIKNHSRRLIENAEITAKRARKRILLVEVSRNRHHNKTISNYENDVSSPDPGTLKLFADIYDIRGLSAWTHG